MLRNGASAGVAAEAAEVVAKLLTGIPLTRLGCCCCPRAARSGDLYRVIKKLGRAKEDRNHLLFCLMIGSDISNAMQYLHSLTPAVIHRDLKSMNILLNEDWDAKVCDFGMSRALDAGRTMTRCGSPAWCVGRGCDAARASAGLWADRVAAGVELQSGDGWRSRCVRRCGVG